MTSHATTTKGQVLVVDDDPAINKLVRIQLGLLGFDVVNCEGIAAAKLLLANKHSFAFVLSDISMPGGSGCDLAQWVKDNFVDMPMYLMTGQSTLLSRAKKDELKVLGLLHKPFQLEDLAAMLAEHFDYFPPSQLQSPATAKSWG